MKLKFALLMFTILFTTSILSAQNRQRATPEERAKRQTESLTEQLSLTDTQKKQVYEINLKYSQPRGEDENLSRENRRESFRKLQEEKDKEVKAVLDDDQKVKYDEIQKEMLQRMRERRPQ